jgi:tetratricopeptide (TPR) repeat protein
MKRLSELEKKQLGILIQYYRTAFFRSATKNKEDYKQVNFCLNICSQAQLSRLERGDVIKSIEVYQKLLEKLNLACEKIPPKDFLIFETYFDNILIFQNDDSLAINYNEYISIINNYYNIFKNNIIYTHYNYALEFIIAILNKDISEARILIEDVESTLEILSPKYLVLTLQYLGKYFHLTRNFIKANKYYLLSIEHMHKYNIWNPIIYLDYAYNNIQINQYNYTLDYLYQALNSFSDSDNYEILAKINYCYALVYINTKYYEDGLNFVIKAIEYSKKVNKRSLLKQQYLLLACLFYLIEDYQKALINVLEAEKLSNDEDSKLFKYIIEKKLMIKNTYEFSSDIYQNIYHYYDDSNHSEYKLVNSIKHLSDSLKIIILQELYQYYKNNKKYKRAIDLMEVYMLKR